MKINLKRFASIIAALCLCTAVSTAVFALPRKAAETQPAKVAETRVAETRPARAAETQPAKATVTRPANETEERQEFKGTVSKKLLEAKEGAELEFEVYVLEPAFIFETSYGKNDINISRLPYTMDLSKEKFVCRAALDPDEKEIIWLVINGTDYSKYISGTKRHLMVKKYKLPAKLKGKVVYSADVADNMEQTISSVKALEFVSIEETIRVFDEKKAVEFSKNKKNDTEAFVENIKRLTPVSYTYSVIGEEINRKEYHLDYLIFEALLDDKNNTKLYIAFDPEKYKKEIDTSVKYEFDGKNDYTYGGRLKGDIKEKKYSGTGLSLYGYMEDAEEVLEGLSQTTGKHILIYDHIKK